MVKTRHGTGWAHRVPRVLEVATFASLPPASAAMAHSHATVAHLPGAMALPQAAMAPLGGAAPSPPPPPPKPLPAAVINGASTVLRVPRPR